MLVIIGLLVGGSLVGKELVHQARLRSAVSQLTQLELAVNTFKIKYGGLPGDMTNATNFFATTTNGNGDGRYYYGTPNQTSESFAALQQLSEDGLIAGSFDGACCTWVKGENGLASKLADDIGLSFSSVSDGSWGTRYGKTHKNLLYVGKLLSNPIIGNGGGVTPIDAESIDNKMDDGEASTGRFIGEQGWSDSSMMPCTDGIGTYHYQGAPGSATYNIDNDDPDCNLDYFLD